MRTMQALRFLRRASSSRPLATRSALLFCAAAAALIAACGTDEEPSTFDKNKKDGSAGDGGNIGPNLNPGDGGSQQGDGSAQNCNQDFSPTAPPPLHLVVLLDYSGSMIASGNNVMDNNGNSITRFEAVRRAWVAYSKLTPQNPVGLTLVPFGLNAKNEAVNVCSEASFAPTLNDTSMPNEAAVTSAIASITPKGSNETPTAGGVLSGLRAARALSTQFPNDDVAIILSTDGAPSMCGTGTAGVDGDPSHIKAAKDAEATALSAGYKTYVVGVGTQWASTLNELAVAGGTGSATNITSGSASVIAQQLQDKLTAVRNDFACKLPLSAEAIADLASTNVIYKASPTSPEVSLVYSQGCPSSETRPAYQYDSVSSPTSIVLCKNECTAYTSSPNAQISLAVGCSPRVQ